MDYVFDACAVIAFLNDENGADTVARLINQAGIGADRIYMSGIQVLEVYYRQRNEGSRRSGRIFCTVA